MTATDPRVEPIFAQLAGQDRPGLVVAATIDGEIVHQGVYGMADMAHGIPLGPRSVLRIGSQTKQFTVLLALLLEREGKLALDHPVHRYAPWLAPTPCPITLRHLASNTSGMRDFLEMMTWSGLALAGPSTRRTAREIIGRHDAVNFVPGEQMIYCNTGFFLLSEIIEEVSGRGYNELLRARITGKLGMDDTCLQLRDSQILPHGVAHHEQGPDGAWERAQWGLVLGGEGGMSSTLEDMLRWQAHLANPPPDIAPLLGRMEGPTRFANGTLSMYGLGFTVNRYRGQRTIGHGGSVAGGRSESVRFPEVGFGAVILGNRDDIAPFGMARRIADAVLGDRLTPPRDPAPLARLAAAAGLYRHDGGDDLFEITAQDGMPLFVANGGTAEFEVVGDGLLAPERSVVHLVLGPPTGDGIPAHWCGAPRRYRRVRPGDGVAGSVAGAYANPALGLDAVVSADARRLTIRSEYGAIRLDLSWIEPDLLMAMPIGAVRSAGQSWVAVVRVAADGLHVTTDRTKDMRIPRCS